MKEIKVHCLLWELIQLLGGCLQCCRPIPKLPYEPNKKKQIGMVKVSLIFHVCVVRWLSQWMLSVRDKDCALYTSWNHVFCLEVRAVNIASWPKDFYHKELILNDISHINLVSLCGGSSQNSEMQYYPLACCIQGLYWFWDGIYGKLSLSLKATTLQIAGGTGVTPMLQVLDAILSNPDDNTQVCPIVSFKPGVTLCFDGTVIAVPTDHLEFVPCTV